MLHQNFNFNNYCLLRGGVVSYMFLKTKFENRKKNLKNLIIKNSKNGC
jgi:hypothetical protein